LAFSALPTSIAAGSAIDPAVQVEAQDAFGNTAASFTGDIAVAVTSGTGVAGASLNGTATQHATAGVATFRDLTIDKAGGGYTLSAVTAGLTGATSNQFTVNVGAARRLSFVSQPNTVVAGAAISPALQVAVLDAGGNRVTTSTASVTMSVTSGSGAVGAALGGTVTQPAASGVATFDNLAIDKAASGYTLTASSSSVTGAASSSFTVMAGPASSLAILTQPATVTVRATIAALRVVVHDAFGNAVVSPSQTVNIGIASGTGSPGAALAGPTSQNTINGEVTFTALSVDRPADGYRLTAVLPGTSMTVTSNAFNAVPPIDPNPDNVTITVADLKANRVVRFTDMSGANWQSGPTVSGRSLDLPWHIGLDASGRIYVANRDIEVIVRMDDVAGDGWKTFGPTNVIVNPGELLKSVNVDQSGHIYFLIESRLVRMDDMDGNGRVTANVPLYNPKTVAFDAQGRIYIADTDNHRVVRINDMSGAGFVSFGSQGSGVGQFNRPEGVAVDALGRIYLTDNENHRIVRINDMSGTGWVTFGSFGGGVGQLNEPHDIAVSAAMRIYVADAGNGRIVRIDDMTGGGWFAFGWRTVQNSSNDTCPVLPNCVLPGKYEFIAPKGIRLQP
jgi:sugar lactone lactonase YvrE